MKKYYLIVIYLLCAVTKSSAQDSIPYTKDFRLYEGLYLSYEEFRVNWPIPKEKIITNINKDQLDFYSKLMDQPFIEYTERDGSTRKILPEKVWGYCQNNTIFINVEKNFFRVPVFGAISSFLGTVMVQAISQSYDPFMNPVIGSSQSRVKEIRQFLFHFYTGEIVPFSIENIEEYIKPDASIYVEYKALNKRKKKEFATKYIRLFNEKHPVYFPKE